MTRRAPSASGTPTGVLLTTFDQQLIRLSAVQPKGRVGTARQECSISAAINTRSRVMLCFSGQLKMAPFQDLMKIAGRGLNAALSIAVAAVLSTP